MSHPWPAVNTLSQGALSLLPGGMQKFSKLFCFLLRMPLHNPGRGETEHAARTLLLTNSSRTLRAGCPVTTVAYSRTDTWEPVGLSLLGELVRCHPRAALFFSCVFIAKGRPLPRLFWHRQGRE